MDLCPLCYKEGRFPSTSLSSDFIKYEPGRFQHGEHQWTDQETLLLLEAIETFDDDWNAIAEHVGTRTREECIMHFLQLPIEEPYVSSQPKSQMFERKRFPFSQADNPVMSILAYLASSVDPEVIAAAADAAVQYQEKGKRKNDDKEESADGTKKPRTSIEKAASVALGSAAAKAKSLAGIEEREIRRLVNSVIDLETKKLELKMSYFDELEAVIENDLEQIAQQRRDIFIQRLAVKKTKKMIDQEINKKGGSIESAVENGLHPSTLQSIVRDNLMKEDYRLVDLATLSEDQLARPVSDNTGEAQQHSILSL